MCLLIVLIVLLVGLLVVIIIITIILIIIMSVLFIKLLLMLGDELVARHQLAFRVNHLSYTSCLTPVPYTLGE